MSNRRWQKLTEEQLVEASAMYLAGASLQKCADYFGVSNQAIWGQLRNRITIRGHGRSGCKNTFFRGGSIRVRRANLVVAEAKANGLIHPLPCEKCGTPNSVAHHDDYNKPLEVRWLCRKHHFEWHKTNKAIPIHGAALCTGDSLTRQAWPVEIRIHRPEQVDQAPKCSEKCGTLFLRES